MPSEAPADATSGTGLSSAAWQVDVGIAATSAGVRHLLDFWRAEVPRHGRLDRRRFEPAQNKALLPWVFIMAPHGGDGDFRHRLVGTGLVALVGQDLTGRSVTELYTEPAEALAVCAFYRQVIAAGLPVTVRGRFDRRSIAGGADRTAEFEGIHLPAWDSRLNDAVILGGLFPTGRQFRMGPLAGPQR